MVDSFNLSTIIPDEIDLGKLKGENPTKYSIRKTQDTPLNPKEREQEQRKEDILKAINEIVPCMHPIKRKEKHRNRKMLRQTVKLTSITNLRIIDVETEVNFNT